MLPNMVSQRLASLATWMPGNPGLGQRDGETPLGRIWHSPVLLTLHPNALLHILLSPPLQPFQKHVYYPLASLEGADVPAAAAGAASLANATSVPLPCFQFRPRLESVDWRRLSAIDVDKVAGAVDVLTLQENIMNITFCKLEDEKCPHCQCGVDPVLLKLIRLAQLTIEYLMHSQEFLTAQLRQLEERLRLSMADCEQSKQLLSKQAGDIKSLKEECKRRKKMISTQQMMIEAKTSYYQVGTLQFRSTRLKPPKMHLTPLLI